MTDSVKFFKLLCIVGVSWMLIGLLGSVWTLYPISHFLLVFYATCINLFALILLYWKMFFNNTPQNNKLIIIVFLSTFKLVCLAFLAITLWRFRNDTPYLWIYALSFYWVGPLLAGVLLRMNDQK